MGKGEGKLLQGLVEGQKRLTGPAWRVALLSVLPDGEVRWRRLVSGRLAAERQKLASNGGEGQRAARPSSSSRSAILSRVTCKYHRGGISYLLLL